MKIKTRRNIVCGRKKVFWMEIELWTIIVIWMKKKISNEDNHFRWKQLVG